MAKLTLDDIRAEAERDNEPTIIPLSDGTKCILPSILNLDGKTSRKVWELLKELQSTDDDRGFSDVWDNARELLSLAGGKNGEKLVEEITSIAEFMVVIKHWTAATQPGEATPSDS